MSQLVRRLLAGTVIALLALAPAASAEVRGSVPLVTAWEFADDPKGPWRSVGIPHVMDPRPTPEVWEGRVAWYRVRFSAPRAERSWWLRFDQVRRRAEAYLNGRPIGTNE